MAAKFKAKFEVIGGEEGKGGAQCDVLGGEGAVRGSQQCKPPQGEKPPVQR